jgi:uncharacterized protein (TIGR00297 family)
MIWLAICIALGIVIYKKEILDLRGSVVATAMGALIVSLAGFEWLSLLVVFLFLAYLSTKYKYNYKDALQIAESNHGRRSAANVLANGLTPTSFAVFWYLNDSHPLTIPIAASYIAAVATVTGDTLSSEIGVLSRKDPLLITTFERVPKGTHGGVSILGETAGLVGTFVIGLVAWGFNLATFEVAILAAVIGGAVGFHFDSLLGALFERKDLIGNGTVNFLATMAGSLVGLYLALSL